MMKIPFLILSFFILVQGLLAQDKAVIDEVIAVVGSEILLKSDYEKQLVQYKTQGNSSDENLPCIMLEDLLYSKLLLNQAKL